ncbi:MAG: hypothetical protein Q8L78_05790 [Coxiellaceae bacterium]|nr:hypothetical protein [Coxiellaceae bacterium]
MSLRNALQAAAALTLMGSVIAQRVYGATNGHDGLVFQKLTYPDNSTFPNTYGNCSEAALNAYGIAQMAGDVVAISSGQVIPYTPYADQWPCTFNGSYPFNVTQATIIKLNYTIVSDVTRTVAKALLEGCANIMSFCANNSGGVMSIFKTTIPNAATLFGGVCGYDNIPEKLELGITCASKV